MNTWFFGSIHRNVYGIICVFLWVALKGFRRSQTQMLLCILLVQTTCNLCMGNETREEKETMASEPGGGSISHSHRNRKSLGGSFWSQRPNLMTSDVVTCSDTLASIVPEGLADGHAYMVAISWSDPQVVGAELRDTASPESAKQEQARGSSWSADCHCSWPERVGENVTRGQKEVPLPMER